MGFTDSFAPRHVFFGGTGWGVIFRGAFVLTAVFVTGAGWFVALGEAVLGGVLVVLAAGVAGLLDSIVAATVGFFF